MKNVPYLDHQSDLVLLALIYDNRCKYMGKRKERHSHEIHFMSCKMFI